MGLAHKIQYLKNNNLFSDLDKAFFCDGYLMAIDVMNNAVNETEIISLSDKLYKNIDELINLFSEECKKKEQKIDCRKGCSICCHQCVLILPHELFCLFNFINNELRKQEIEEIKEKVIKKHTITKNMKAQEFFHYKHPCPLLRNNSCMVYEVRPMACRIYLSSDVNSCEREYKYPTDFNIFPSLFQFPLRAGRMMNEGVYMALSENSYSQTELKLETALFLIFKDKSLLNKWLQKENVFQEYQLTDNEIAYLLRFGKSPDYLGDLSSL